MNKIITTAQAPEPIGPYSQAVEAGITDEKISRLVNNAYGMTCATARMSAPRRYEVHPSRYKNVAAVAPASARHKRYSHPIQTSRRNWPVFIVSNALAWISTPAR